MSIFSIIFIIVFSLAFIYGLYRIISGFVGDVEKPSNGVGGGGGGRDDDEDRPEEDPDIPEDIPEEVIPDPINGDPPEHDPPVEDVPTLEDLEVENHVVEKLREDGIESVKQIREKSDLTDIHGIGPTRAKKIREEISKTS